MTTSPKALSPLAFRVKEMLPLRPVAALEYEPSQWPASAATSRVAPTSGTGVCVAGPHAARSAATAGPGIAIRDLIGNSLSV